MLIVCAARGCIEGKRCNRFPMIPGYIFVPTSAMRVANVSRRFPIWSFSRIISGFPLIFCWAGTIICVLSAYPLMYP